jgi:drug/metabolite transporter, DME family
MARGWGALSDAGSVNKASTGSLFVLAAAVLWGTTGTAQAFAPESAGPLSVGAVRIAAGGIAMLGFAALRGELQGIRNWPPLATAGMALAVAAYQPLFFAGVSLTGVAVGTVAAIGSAPVWAGLIGLLFGGEKPSARWVLATALAVAGCALLLLGSGAGSISADPFGVLLCLAAGLGYVIFATIAKGFLRTEPQAAVMGVVFTLGALALSPAILFTDFSWLAEPRGALAAAELGLLATAAAYLLFAAGLSRVPVATAATLSLAEPLTAGTLGVFLLDERLSPVAITGMALLLSGLVLTSTSDSK